MFIDTDGLGDFSDCLYEAEKLEGAGIVLPDRGELGEGGMLDEGLRIGLEEAGEVGSGGFGFHGERGGRADDCDAGGGVKLEYRGEKEKRGAAEIPRQVTEF
jgi:hypothetical protein